MLQKSKLDDDHTYIELTDSDIIFFLSKTTLTQILLTLCVNFFARNGESWLAIMICQASN